MKNVLLSLFIWIACSLSAAAAPGDLDPAFGRNGVTNTTIGAYDDVAACVAVQSDGKVVVAGYSYNADFLTDFSAARYLADGALDVTFNGVGYVTIPMSSSYDEISAVAIQGDGKIVVAGYARVGATEDFALARLNADGSLDAAFSGTGKVTTPIGTSHERIAGVAIQSDGKIVVAGYARLSGIYRVALARYNADGTLDASFDGDGKLTTAVGAVDDRANAVALQPDGKIVVAGASDNGTDSDFALARYLPDGSLDASFGGDGIVTAAIGSAQDGATCVAIQNDGKIVAAGYMGSYMNYDFAVARFQSNGVLDAGFGGSGAMRIDFNSSDDFASALLLQGRSVLVAGYTASGGYQDFALVRYNENGTLDNAFGGDSTVVTQIGSGNDGVKGVAYAGNGKIVAAGYAQIGNYSEFALARYEANSRPTLTLTGDNPLTCEASGIYADPGATASDFEEGPLSPAITLNTVVANATGTYSVVWTACDAGGLTGSVTRVVRVVDTTAPAFTQVPAGGTVPFGSPVPDVASAAAATDNSAGPVVLTQQPAAGSPFGPAGPFSITLTATDPSGNAASTNVTYTVSEPNHPPVVTLIGDNPLTLEADNSYYSAYYIDPGATASDIEDGTLTPQRVNDNNFRKLVGTYEITWQAIDSGGLTGTVTRTVYVRDTRPPVFINVPPDGIAPVGGPVPSLAALATIDDSSTVTFTQSPPAGSLFGLTPGSTCEITLTATDASANSSQDTVMYTLRAVIPGDVDPGFGNNGWVSTLLTNHHLEAAGMVLQSDGKIVVAGTCSQLDTSADFAVLRYNTDGTLDATFGDGGIVTTDFGTTGDIARSVAVQSDGKIVVTGSCGPLTGSPILALARYNPDGNLDTSFNGTGKVTNDNIYNSSSRSGCTVALQSDGKIVVTGEGYELYMGLPHASYVTVRYCVDGSLDTTFNGTGMVSKLVTTGAESGGASGIVIQGDGKIVACGPSNFSIVRWNPDGSLDDGFGNHGMNTYNFRGYGDAARCVGLQSDGQLIVAGHGDNDCDNTIGGGGGEPNTEKIGMLRFNYNGILDTTFGEGTIPGEVMSRFYCQQGYPEAMAIQSDDRIVVVGNVQNELRVARFQADGDVDWSFNNGGGLFIPDVMGSGVVVQSDRKIVIAGTSEYRTNDTSRQRIVLFRLQNPLTSDIVVMNPAGTAIADGGTNVLGAVAVGFPTEFTFAVTNRGAGNLTGLDLTINGTHASSYSVSRTPASSLMQEEWTLFSLRLLATSPGVKTATLHIANNDPDNDPFDINLTATCLSFQADTDGDGLSDASELQMAALGFDWQVNQPSLVATLFENAGRAGLFTPTQVQDLNVGMHLLSRDPVTGECLLTIGVQKSTDLLHFEPLPVTAPQLGVNGQGQIEFRFQATNGAAFFRLQSR